MKTKKRLVKNKIKGLKIEAKPLTEQQIRDFVGYFNINGSFPGSKIPCNVTGKLTTCIGPWMKKKIEEFGGAENLLRNYKCRGAIKAARQIIKPMTKKGKKRNFKLKEMKDEQQNWCLPKITFDPPMPLNSAQIADTTRNQCLRPDIFLSNGRHCDGCEYTVLCTNALKTFPTENIKKTSGQKIKRK